MSDFFLHENILIKYWIDQCSKYELHGNKIKSAIANIPLSITPDIKEIVLGSAEIQKVFKVSSAGKIAGSKVISGEIQSKSKAEPCRPPPVSLPCSGENYTKSQS